jgi:hypothetical protein
MHVLNEYFVQSIVGCKTKTNTDRADLKARSPSTFGVFNMKRNTTPASGKGMFYDAFAAMGLDMTPESEDVKLTRELAYLRAQQRAIQSKIAALEALQNQQTETLYC